MAAKEFETELKNDSESSEEPNTAVIEIVEQENENIPPAAYEPDDIRSQSATEEQVRESPKQRSKEDIKDQK
ncbi:hypothetical protein Tco_1216360 [Tanacetum coccineum]